MQIQIIILFSENQTPTKAIQVCWHLDNDSLQRELNGLKAAMEESKVKEGIIITHNQEDQLDSIQLVPAWKWL